MRIKRQPPTHSDASEQRASAWLVTRFCAPRLTRHFSHFRRPYSRLAPRRKRAAARAPRKRRRHRWPSPRHRRELRCQPRRPRSCARPPRRLRPQRAAADGAAVEARLAAASWGARGRAPAPAAADLAAATHGVHRDLPPPVAAAVAAADGVVVAAAAVGGALAARELQARRTTLGRMIPPRRRRARRQAAMCRLTCAIAEARAYR